MSTQQVHHPKIFLEPKSRRPQAVSPLVLKSNWPGKTNNNKTQSMTTTTTTTTTQNNSSSPPPISSSPKLSRNQTIKKKTKPPKITEKCMARTSSGDRCNRTQGSSDLLCSCHHKHCPFGRMDGPLEGKFLRQPRKRGPKFKNTVEYKLEDLDTNLYTECQMLKLDGESYLIDQHGILYTNDTSKAEIIGRRDGDLIYWFN